MRNFFRQNIYLNLGLIFCICSILIIGLFSSYLPTIGHWGQKYEDLHFNLSASFVSSYIFYYIVVHLKEKKDFKNTAPHLNILTDRILALHKSIIIGLDRRVTGTAQYDGVPTLTESELDVLIDTLNYEEKAPLHLASERRSATWREYLIIQGEDIKKNIDKILVLTPFLQSDFAKIILELDSTIFLKFTEDLKSPTFYAMITNPKSISHAHYYYKFHKVCLELERYQIEHLS